MKLDGDGDGVFDEEGTHVWRYYHKDHLGGNTIVTDSQGDVVSTMRYHPYGKTASRTGQKPIYGFAGGEIEEEEELGLIQFGARWYAPEIGRWVSADPLFLEGATTNVKSVLEGGLYSYGLNSPIVFIDKAGTYVGIRGDIREGVKKAEELSEQRFILNASPAEIEKRYAKKVTKDREAIVMIDKEGAGGQGHMGLLFQNAKGEWFYMSQGMTGDADNSEILSGSEFAGGVGLQKVQVKDEDGKLRNATRSEALKMAQSGKLGNQYDDFVSIKTSKFQADQIHKNAKKYQTEMKKGKKKYQVYFENCADAVQTVLTSKTTIDLPLDIDPRPNSYFDELTDEYPKADPDADMEFSEEEATAE